MDFMTLPELATYLRVDEKGLANRWKTLGIPAYRVGNRLRFDTAEVNRWVRSHRAN